MHSTPELLLDRVDRFLNDFLPRGLVADHRPLRLSAWTVPADAEGVGEPIPFATAVELAEFEDVAEGFSWGPAWGTTWFRVEGEVPAEWADAPGRVELSLDLGFTRGMPGFQCEGLVRTLDGRAVKGLEPLNHHVPVDARPGESFAFLVEAAANPDLGRFSGPDAFVASPLGDKATAGLEPRYRLGGMRLRRVDTEVEALIHEVVVARGLAVALPEHEPRRARLLAALERGLYAVDPGAPGAGAAAARRILAPSLDSPAAPSAHRVVATGHAHIDSAWLWPSRETVRKVTRTYSNVVDLLDRDPDAVFASSSAQHFAWVQKGDPDLFERIRAYVAEGRFVPVGNTWVECDVNMPSGESLARQLLYGTRFFEREFGVRSEVGWLPDSFGYPGSLPQLLRRAGIRWFFTQKMCWNDVDTMPHHSFDWEGIDGSRVFTHFTPNNTYNGTMHPSELARSVENFSDHAGAGTSLMPFGYGDGGGGPTREMMTLGRLQADLEGSARVQFDTPQAFFAEADEAYADRPVWAGEMYLEFHRGVFTSQSRTKRGNRRNEALLVEAELWWAQAAVLRGAAYPHDELDALWEQILLLQFHDILPGSSIAWVHREAEEAHAVATERLEALIDRALAVVVGEGDAELVANPAPSRCPGCPATASAPRRRPRRRRWRRCRTGRCVSPRRR
ncbi:alpha-mannosidase [Tessaracoccus defluvii]|uniref:alpha-mannosidase n=1 Tax=Tessaracoccus defluvii TaxID=1285901 RepID=UPI001D03A187|nr:alpha-mannosidase [Tessaracoccus defluvii]